MGRRRIPVFVGSTVQLARRRDITVTVKEVLGNGDYFWVDIEGKSRLLSRNALYLSSVSSPSLHDATSNVLHNAESGPPSLEHESSSSADSMPHEKSPTIDIDPNTFWKEFRQDGVVDPLSSFVANVLLWILSQFLDIQDWIGIALIGLCPILWLTIRNNDYLNPLLGKIADCLKKSDKSSESVLLDTFIAKLFSITLVFAVAYLLWGFVYASVSHTPEDWYPIVYQLPTFGEEFGFSILWMGLNYMLGEFVRRSIPATQEACHQTLSDYVAKHSYFVLRFTILWCFVVVIALLVSIFVLHFGLGRPRLGALVGLLLIFLFPTAAFKESWWNWIAHGFGVFISVLCCFLVLFMQPLTLFNLVKCIWILPHIFTFACLRLDGNDQTNKPQMLARCEVEVKIIRHLVDVLVAANKDTYF